MRNVIALFIATAACSSSAPPAPAPQHPPALSLVERLSLESSSRPAAHPPVEAVAAALSRQGLPLERWKQVLGSAVGARYCMAGQTARGNVVSVCEFAGDTEAERGLRYSHEAFDRLIANRTLVRRAGTVLTVARADEGAASISEARTISAIFSAL
jgi:hypothetical protein